MKQKEVFIINDVTLDVNPSDIRLIDDTYAMRESYLRSNAVFSHKSKYASSKIVVTIPVQSKDINNLFSYKDYSDLSGIVKVIVQLNNYPFCFIKSKRIESYVSPTAVSEKTNFMIFAVDELNIVTKSELNDVMLLEVVLVYFNHKPFVDDFTFARTLNTSSNPVDINENSNIKFETEYLYNDVGVTSLEESEAWFRYFNKTLSDIKYKVTRENANTFFKGTRGNHFLNSIKLAIGIPTVKVITLDSSQTDFSLVNGETKLVVSSNTELTQEELYTNLLTNKSAQDFRKTLSEDKQFKELVGEVNPETIIDKITNFKAEEKAEFFKKHKVFAIDYVDMDLTTLNIAVQSFEYRKKNRLAINHIGSLKHPVVQFMGRYPTELSINFTSNINRQYEGEYSPDRSISAIVKEQFNIIDYNASLYPEVTAYNNLKIKTTPTLLTGNVRYLPNQVHISATSQQQGLDSFACTFVESDLTELFKLGEVVNSGKKGGSQLAEFSHKAVQQFLKEMKQLLQDRNQINSLSETDKEILLNLYSRCLQLVNLISMEFGTTDVLKFATKDVAKDLVDTYYLPLLLSLTQENVNKNYFDEICAAFGGLLGGSIAVLSGAGIVFTGAAIGVGTEVGSNFSEIARSYVGSYRNPFFYSIIFDKSNTGDYARTNALQLLGAANKAKQDVKNLIQARLNIVTNTNVSSFKSKIQFREFPETINAFREILSYMQLGAEKGNQICQKVVSSFNKQFFELIGQQTVSFTGQAIPDIKLDKLVNNYVTASDSIVQNVNPFFFLREYKHFEDLEIEEIFNQVTELNNALEDATGITDTIVEIVAEEPLIDKVAGDPDASSYQSAKINYVMPIEAEYKYATVPEPLLKFETALAEVERQERVKNKAPLTNSTSPDYTSFSDNSVPLINDIKRDHDREVLLKYKSRVNLPLTDDQWLYYANTIAHRESTYRHNIKGGASNAYIGKYQLGTAALVEGQVLDRASSAKQPFAWQYPAKWLKNWHADFFLATPDLQAFAMANHTNANIGFISAAFKKAGLRSFESLPLEQRLALLSVAHLTGAGTVVDFMRGVVKQDANGIKNKSRYDEMLSVQKQLISGPLTGTTDTTVEKYSVVFIEAVNGVTFKGKDLRTNKEFNYRFHGASEALESGKINFEALGKNPTDLDKTLKSRLTTFMKRHTNLLVQDQGDTAAGDKLVVVTSGNNNLNNLVLAEGFGFIDPVFKSNNAYLKNTQAAEEAKRGVFALLSKDGVISSKEAKSSLDTGARSTKKFTDNELRVASNVSSLSSNTDKGKVLQASQAPFLNKDAQFVISSGFGIRTLDGKTGPHKGIDIICTTRSVQGMELVSLADGVVESVNKNAKGYGYVVRVAHGGDYSTVYGHMSRIDVKQGQRVIANKTILGLAGGAKNTKGAGSSTGAHLHYEILYKNRQINPYKILDLGLAAGGIGGILEGIYNPSAVAAPSFNVKKFTETVPSSRLVVQSVYDESLLLNKIVEKLNKNVNKGMAQAFPTIKVYITVGNEDQDYWLGLDASAIEYYELKGIRDFSLVTSNQNNPIDVVSMVVADPNFIKSDEVTSMLSTVYYKAEDGSLTKTTDTNGISIDAIGTDYERQFKNNRIKLRPGMKLHVRLGYENNPNKLDIVFNGSVISTQNVSANSIRVVAESFGKELLTDVLGTTEPQRLGGGWNSSTGSIFADLMLLPGIFHFGKSYSFLRMISQFTLGDEIDPEAKSLLRGNTNSLSQSFTNAGSANPFNTNYYLGFKIFSNVVQRSRVYTNIYTADIEHVDSEFDSPVANLFANSLFNLNRAITYDYFAVNETPWETMKQMTYRHPGTIVKPMWYQDRCTLFYGIKEQLYIARDSDNVLMKEAVIDKDNSPEEQLALPKYAEVRSQRMEPACNFHILSTELNIINNAIKLNGNYFTKVNVAYRDDNDDITTISDWETLQMSLDDNLSPWSIRSTELTLSGCDKRYMAYRYGTQFLLEEAEKMYEGKILIVGNPSMKAGDYAFIKDTNKRMFGIIKIRECKHYFNEKDGFITEITPGQFVEPAEFVRSTFFLRLGLVAKGLMDIKSKSLLGKAFSSESLQMFVNYLYLQDQFAKLNEISGSADILKTDTYAAGLTEDPGFTLTHFGMGAFFTYLTYRTGKNLIIKTGLDSRFGFFNKGALQALSKAASNTGAYLARTFSKARPALGVNVAARSALFNGLLTLDKFWYGPDKAAALAKGALRLPVIGVNLTARLLVRSAIATASTTMLAISIFHPIGFLVTVATSLALSWANAKIEENKYTRQPALFYPLVYHGKYYVAGMDGAVRNTYFDSLILEGKTTIAQIQKAATIVDKKRQLTGNSTLFPGFLKNGEYKRRVTFELDSEGNVVKNLYGVN